MRMGVAHVRQEIIAQARQEAATMQRSASQQAAEILRDAEGKLAEYRVVAEQKCIEVSQRMAQQELAGARFEAKKLVLNTRKALIDAVFADLAEKLAVLPERNREELLGKLLVAAEKEIAVHTVHVNARDAGMMSKRKTLFVKPARIIGGLIGENADGTVRVDLSFDQMLQQLRDQELASIARELF